MTYYYTLMDSPLQTLIIGSDGEHIVRLFMDGQKYASRLDHHWKRDDALLADAVSQLGAYFAGELTRFDLPLKPAGTAFQQQVWQALTDIPYGKTASYGEIANRLNKPKAVRAVGAANGRNPIGIIIPCHRVVGANGSLTGYAGGIERKQWLLRHEQG